jgi:hypothetical protein
VFARLRAVLGSLPRELTVALVVTVIATIAPPPLVALLTEDRLHDWVAAVVASATFLAGVALGTAMSAVDEREKLDAKIRELESRTGELGAYETYAEHLRDALQELRQVVARELPSFSTRDFIETGIFEPAHALLQRDHRDEARGDVRFSILRPRGDDFVMADEERAVSRAGSSPGESSAVSPSD